jgi:glutamate-1-semialdehyde 2,1-aminomutase
MHGDEFLVGGVNSPVRAFAYADVPPLLVRSAKGSTLTTADEKTYLDYVLGWGVNILGHTPMCTRKVLREAASCGTVYGVTCEDELLFAETLCTAVPLLEKIRSVNSGTEAVMSAIRLARGFTGRDLIVKFKRAYHGHSDGVLVDAGSGVATFGIGHGKGIPQETAELSLVLDQTEEAVCAAFAAHGDRIAAVILEPVGANDGVVLPDVALLQALRALCLKHGSLLIFDEVVTGFRFHAGLAADILGVRPDLVCLGKIVGGGLPIGVYGGRADIMQRLAPCGDVYQAATFGGNPLTMRAGRAMLQALTAKKDAYPRLTTYAQRIADALREGAAKHGVAASVIQYGGMFSIDFADKMRFRRWYRAVLAKGIYLAQSEHEASFVSFAHTKRDIIRTCDAVNAAFASIG